MAAIPEVRRPWGSYRILVSSPNGWIKVLTLNQGARISYQTHRLRDETWTVIRGRGVAMVDSLHWSLAPFGMTLNIPRGAAHRIQNVGRGKLVLLEVARGSCRESDITRHDDDYGRTK